MIDPATGWFEIIKYNDKWSVPRENLAEQIWFCRYLRPTITIYNEFIGLVFKNN